MDGQIKIPLKGGVCDEDKMHFQGLASPAKSDGSSVDIYDDLDMVTSIEQAPEESNPVKTCLDLYEEILTEEGTAKETSFSKLSAEYEKCQRQMKQLIIKLKQTQSLNTTLQNENRCLRKNISALIKTARVEITRKEEEIKILNERLCASAKNRSFHPLPLLNIKKKSNDDDLSKNLNTEKLPKKDTAFSGTIDKASCYPKKLCDKEKTCMENRQLCTSINYVGKLCKDSPLDHSQEQTFEPLSLEGKEKNRNEIGLDSRNKETERILRKERPKSTIANSVNESFDVKEKAPQLPAKSGKKESSQENKNSRSEVSCEKENHKDHSSSTKEKKQLKDLDYSKEKVKKYERSPHTRESRAYGKEKHTESKHRTVEKNEEPRRSTRTHYAPKDDGSHKVLELSDGRRSSCAGRKDKYSSEYSESKIGDKDLKPKKHEHSTRTKTSLENKSERSDRDRTEKKRSRDEPDRSRHDKKDKGHQREGKIVRLSSRKDKSLHYQGSEKNKPNEKAIEVNSGQKDLKLSFMETLNLTLSPTKKTSTETQVLSSAPSMECEVEGKLAKTSSPLCGSENNVDSLHSQETDLRPIEHLMDNHTTKVLNVEESKLESYSGPVSLNEQPINSAVDENSELMAKLTVEDKPVGFPVLNAVYSKEMDTRSVLECSDPIDLDSFIELDRCSGSHTSTGTDTCNASEHIQDDGCILKICEEEDNKTVEQTSNLAEDPKGIYDSPDTDCVNISTKEIENKHCFPDEGSVDLSFLRPIPEVLSPLKSPVRSKTLHTLGRTAKSAVVSSLYKESLPETNIKSNYLSVSEELNKENCQPDNKSDLSCKNLAPTSDELEEGEILSEDEQTCQQPSWTVSSPSQLAPEQVASATKSHSVQGNDIPPLSKTDTLIMADTSATKPKTCTPTKLSAFPANKQKKPNEDSCLDGILKIVTPSSIQDVLQMLRIIRKHIRKKYMKFKIQFSLTQFQRVIEAGTLYFLTLVKSLDWSNLCSTPERLQKKLCSQIESRLKKLKKNGIVDRIFEQHLTDMKKRLWKFVEEQLDSLFDILKSMILKFCDKAEMKQNPESCANIQKPDSVKNPSNKRIAHADKVCLPSGSVPLVKQREFPSQAGLSNPDTQNNNDRALPKDKVKELTKIDLKSKNVDISSSNGNLASKLPHLSPAKSSVSNKQSPESKLNSSGLSFNLVSDDHMGDVFKSLLNTDQNLPSNPLPKSRWILDTPDKTISSSQKSDNVVSQSETKPPTKAGFSWCSVSPQHVQAFPMVKTVLDPDVFDENCLLEIPTSSSKTLNGSEDRPKCYSSVLMEDLAVSLTVPSPLKSDSHLSFLRPVSDTELVSEVDLKCSEKSVLDDEDAVEHDLHLTLDSDNSSIGSLEDTVESGSFQYHPSEPMQAVIMEKSNDHFIVKIRRAVSSSSPASDCPSERTDIAVPESLQTVDGNKVEKETELDMQSGADISSVQSHTVHLDKANVTENNLIDAEKAEEIPLLGKEIELGLKFPPNKNQHLEIPAEIKLPAKDNVEHSEIDCEKKVTNFNEETCGNVPAADTLPIETSDTNTVDLNIKKKKRLSLVEEPSAKRQKIFPAKDKMEDLQLETSNKKKRCAVGNEAINFQVSPTSLSAKNVIKKKGEVVVSWTRDEDRAILLECQKCGPTKKTFVFLSSTMKKYPHQVEDRFRQLMKLFKKSKNSSC